MIEAGSILTIGVLAGIDVDVLRGLSEFKSEGKAGAFPFPFELGRWLTGVEGFCSDYEGTRSDSSPMNIPLRELPHPFEDLSSSFSRGGMGLFCDKIGLASTSLMPILRRLVCFDEEVTSPKSFAIEVVVGESSLPGMVTATIELLSDSWLSLMGGSLPR